MTKADPHGVLVDVQRRLEGFYGLPAQPAVSDFLIPPQAAAAYPGNGSRTLVTEDADGLSIGVLLEPAVLDRLAHGDPRVRLDDGNLHALCAATEEVSHFLYLLFHACAGRAVTELELELQGEVDKYLNAVFLLSLQNEGAVSARLRELLFQRYRLDDRVSPERALRYRAASDLAYRYCGWLENRFLRTARLAELRDHGRRFYRFGQREKLETIARVH
ncbi:MAG TPA: hypothetical protein VFQ51_03745 [Vicinamibacteria bacterium]|nr:hypothetical protein [Vicinamibacteria bacterium]